MKTKIVRLEINDDAWQDTIFTYMLINPNEEKFAELKHMIEHRFDTDGLTDEEIAEKENFRDFIWDRVDEFIKANFIVLDIDETYEILY